MRLGSRWCVIRPTCAFKTVMACVPMFNAVVLLAAARVVFGAGEVLISKCCPLDHQLSGKFQCIPLENADENATVPAEETVEAIRVRNNPFPWWMDANASVFGSFDERVKSDSFLGEQPGNLVVKYDALPECPGSMKFFTTKDTNTTLLRNGTLVVRLESTPGADTVHVSFGPEEYCTDKVQTTREVFLYLLCPCDKTLCINKCCNRNQFLVVNETRKVLKGSCDKRGRPWEPTMYLPNDTNVTVPASYVMLYPGFPRCEENYNQVFLNGPQGPYTKFWIFPNGSVLVDGFGHGVPYPRGQYCADWTPDEGGRLLENLYFCVVLQTYEPPTPKGAAYAVLHVVGAAFLLLTLLVYGVVPELRRPAHGKALMCHAASMMLGSVGVAWAQLQRRVPEEQCYASAFLIQYLYLATFFWLNILCLDASWRFRKVFALPGENSNGRKFLYFSLYAWGCPALVSVLTVFLEFTENLPEYLLRPNIGELKCWFSTKEAAFAYFYGPMGVLLFINVVLFTFTLCSIAREQRDAGILNDNSLFNKRKQKLLLYVRLFCLMGVTWVMEIVSAAVGGDDALWYVTDAINMLRGLFVFVFFCCKRKVLRRLSDRLRCAPAVDARREASCTQSTSMQLSTSAPTPSPRQRPSRDHSADSVRL